MMKYLRLPLLLVIAFSSTYSCKKTRDLTQFTLAYDEYFTVPSTLGVNVPFNIVSPEIESNSKTEFEANDTNTDLIEEIRLTKMTLELVDPMNSDLSFLSSVEIFMSASGLPEISLAHKNNIPDNVGKTLNLDLSNKDFQEYIKKDKFSLRLNTKTDKFISSDHRMLVNYEFFVDARVLGL